MLKKAIYTLLLLPGITVFAQNKEAKLSGIMNTYHNYNMFEGAVLPRSKEQVEGTGGN